MVVAQNLTNSPANTNQLRYKTDWVVSLDVLIVTTSAQSRKVCKTFGCGRVQSVDNLGIFNEKPELDITGSPY